MSVILQRLAQATLRTDDAGVQFYRVELIDMHWIRRVLAEEANPTPPAPRTRRTAEPAEAK